MYFSIGSTLSYLVSLYIFQLLSTKPKIKAVINREQSLTVDFTKDGLLSIF